MKNMSSNRKPEFISSDEAITEGSQEETQIRSLSEDELSGVVGGRRPGLVIAE
jgi:hypothetical protein